MAKEIKGVKSLKVSIQPKPKNGLEEELLFWAALASVGFNPAEAEEGFSSIFIKIFKMNSRYRFNPAEAEEGFSGN